MIDDQNGKFIQGFSVPIRIAPSHGQNHIGGASDKKRSLAMTSLKTPIVIFDHELVLFALDAADSKKGWQTLNLIFKQPVLDSVAVSLALEFCMALSIEISNGDVNPHLGTFFIEIDWFNWNVIRTDEKRSITGDITARVTMTLEHRPYEIKSNNLAELKFNPHVKVFYDGLCAENPKTKYLCWFSLLEDLENRKEFLSIFRPLFSGDERDRIELFIKNFDTERKNRFLGIINDKKCTVEKRPEKLAEILKNIGCKEITHQDGTVTAITSDLCKSIIKGRNSLAHKGSDVNESVLYQCLLPISRAALAYLSR